MTKMERLIELLVIADERLRNEIGATLLRISACQNLDKNLTDLPRLRKVKMAVVSVMRAAKKNDFTLL